MDPTYRCSVCNVDVDGFNAFMIRDTGLCFQHYNETPAGKARPAIREEDKLDESWFRNASEVKTPEDLIAFMRQVMNGYVHDYGSVCKAIAACAVAAAWCANRAEGANGGITGFQSGAVMWQFVKAWMHLDSPLRLIDFRQMLYPQSAARFERTLDPQSWAWVQGEARRLLREGAGAPAVLQHWKDITDGKVPFGFLVSDDD